MGKHERKRGWEDFVDIEPALRAVQYHSGGIITPAPPPAPEKFRNVSAEIMVHSDAAVAEVRYQVPQPDGLPKTFTGGGVSKREREDNPDPVTAEVLAMARAFEELSARLFREARRRIRVQDSERHQRETRRTREEWEQIQHNQKLAENLGFTMADGKFSGNLMSAAEVPESGSIDVTGLIREALTQSVGTILDVVKLLHK